MSLDNGNKPNENLPVSEKERILKLSILEFCEEELKKASSQSEKTKWGYIKKLRKPRVASLEVGNKVHPKLYQWLWDECRLLGVETVGDLVTVMKISPPKNQHGQEPWFWLVSSNTKTSDTIFSAYDRFKKKGLFLDSH